MVKRRWWAAVIALVLIAAILLAAFWDAVSVRVAPKLVLSKALSETFSQLESRFEGSPLHLLSDAIDPEGRQQIGFCLDTATELLGVVRYDMTIHTQGSPARLLAEGSVTTGGRKLDMKLFLNDTFGAVSSETLVGQEYFGVEYDTFSEDIRRNQLLAYLIGEETLEKWDTSIASLQEAMGRSYTLPEIAPEDIRSALFGVLALKARVDTQEMILSNQTEKVHTVTFQATGQEIAAAAEPYSSKLSSELRELVDSLKDDPDAMLSAVFSLHKGKLVRITGTLVAASGYTQITVDLGTAPQTEPLTLELQTKAGEDLTRFSFLVNNSVSDEHYAETIQMTRTQNALQHKTTLDYNWAPSSGDMKLTVLRDNIKTDLRLNLQAADEGFTLTTNDFEALLGIFTGREREQAAICTMTVTPGSPVEVPEYRNFDTWSMEDLLNLLSGLGGLLGLKFD